MAISVSINETTFPTTPDSVSREGPLRADHIVVQPADQRPGPGPGEERDRHLQDMIENGSAQIQDQPFTDPRRQPAGQQSEPGLGDRYPGDEIASVSTVR